MLIHIHRRGKEEAVSKETSLRGGSDHGVGRAYAGVTMAILACAASGASRCNTNTKISLKHYIQLYRCKWKITCQSMLSNYCSYCAADKSKRGENAILVHNLETSC